VVLFLSSCNPVRGFLESEFILSPESPLPAWYPVLPEGISRKDITIRIKCYSPLFPVNNTVFIVEHGWWRTLYTASGNMEYHKKYWAWAQKNWPARAYPSYSTISVNGQSEIIEHKKEGNVLFISNEKAVADLLGTEY
jgi:hypothetical protein